MVTTKYGPIEGIDRGCYVEYRGIPYAKAPVGELRWRAPQPPDPFEGVYMATDFKNACMQMEHIAPPYDKDFYDDPAFSRPKSEDCLYLHIWAPKDAENAPVAFWIHGGAFLGGWGSEKEFDGAAYAKRGVIFVSIEYRCNIFGFFAHPWLSAEQGGRSGNYGILDQIAALDWVRENIGAFGGDKDSVTIFGQSAGAMSVQTLVSSPLTEGKIARAIMQSGGSYGRGLHNNITLPEQEAIGADFAEMLGAKDLGDLRSRSADELFSAMGELMKIYTPKWRGIFLSPTVDGWLLPDSYNKLIDENRIHFIPYMIGSTKDDIAGDPGLIDKRESVLYKGSVAFSKRLEELGREPAFVYWFKRDLPGDNSGAYHSSELLYMMGTLDRCWRPWTEGDRRLSGEMVDYWANFIRSGDPNGDGLPSWKRCSAGDPFVMDFDA